MQALFRITARRTRVRKLLVSALLGCAVCSVPNTSFADEGGVSFWLPGLFGSLAATPLQPGMSLLTTYYHTSVWGGADVSRAREITIGNFPINFSGSANLNLNAKADLGLLNAIYVFPTSVLGGQAAIGLMGIFGRTTASVAGTLTGAIQGPAGTLIPFARSDTFGDGVT